MIIDGTPTLVEDGTLDLSSMDDSGLLESGFHTPAGVGVTTEIEGKADGDQLFINHKGKNDLYSGILVFEDPSEERLIIGGLFDKDTTNNDRVSKLLSQDEGTWVITRP
jgi:hypothetical protein